nr:hypothetical protein [Paenibacillus xylanexedens]
MIASVSTYSLASVSLSALAAVSASASTEYGQALVAPNLFM